MRAIHSLAAAALYATAAMTAMASAACFTTNGEPPGGSVGEVPVVDGNAPPDAMSPGDDGATGQPDSAPDAASADRSDAGRDAQPFAPTCSSYAPPTMPGQCHGCPPRRACQVNGCYGGYWCDLGAGRCVPHPAVCP